MANEGATTSGESLRYIVIGSREAMQQLRDNPQELLRAAGLGVGPDATLTWAERAGGPDAQAADHCHIVCFCTPEACDCVVFCH